MLRRNKGLILLVAMVLVAILFAGCSQGAAPAPAGGGGTEKLQGEGQGFKEGSPIKVEVTLEEGKITAIEILEHEETAGISDPAFEKIPQAIIDAQSTNVDAVSGATKTSEGIKAAVKDATGK
ncbi:MAG: FMN-binding protein [Bacillota bacterium]|nr:FMN-binding protein [Bacillota bacterium]